MKRWVAVIVGAGLLAGRGLAQGPAADVQAQAQELQRQMNEVRMQQMEFSRKYISDPELQPLRQAADAAQKAFQSKLREKLQQDEGAKPLLAREEELNKAMRELYGRMRPDAAPGRPEGATARPEINSPFDATTLRPFTDGVPYEGTYETGLYPGATNTIPPAHRAAGERVAAAIRPLDAEGRPDDAGGRVVALVFGHSNGSMYFSALQNRLREFGGELSPRFALLNAAVGGNQLPQIRALSGAVWNKAAEQLEQVGCTPRQVQILFLHTTYQGAMNPQLAPPPPFPSSMRDMQKDLAAVLGHCVELYPNLRIAYLTCDGFRHFTGYEPHVWREAFAFKWLIESQIKGEAGTAFEDKDGRTRALPWLQWGPYIWDNTWDRSWFTDGVHPGPKALSVFVDRYVDFLRADPAARGWLWAPAR